MSAPSFRAITTRYKGCNFRSRLEARWAVFFDHLGIRWDYEPEGFELGNGLRYLPDFWLPDWKIWVEVKPAEPDDVASEKALRLVMNSGFLLFMTKGNPDNAGTLFFTHTQMGGEIGLMALPAVPYWVNGPRICMFHDMKIREYDQDKTTALQLDYADEIEHTVKFNNQSAPMQGALDAARGAQFEFGKQGAQ